MAATRRKRRTTKKRKVKRGGTKIGEGITGAVFYPALKCKNPEEQPSGDYVSKLVTKTAGENEMEKTRILNGTNLDFVIYPKFMCEAAEQGRKTHLLFSKFGGHSLLKYYLFMEEIRYGNRKKEEFDESYYNNIMNALDILAKNVTKLNNLGIYHNDISVDNILYNETENKAYLIDFERATMGKPATKRPDSVTLQGVIQDFKDFRYFE
jgi:serine/threonine protein kinase